MAGGLFGRPFAVNPKCVAFAIVVIAALLACPRFPTPGAKLACLVAVFVASYVAMAWYDHFFDCGTLPLKRGPAWGPTQVFKPPAHRPEEQNREDVHAGDEKRAQLVYGMHLIIIAPLLGYVALKGGACAQADMDSAWCSSGPDRCVPRGQASSGKFSFFGCGRGVRNLVCLACMSTPSKKHIMYQVTYLPHPGTLRPRWSALSSCYASSQPSSVR